MGYDILILTDHSAHTSQNSLYALAASLSRHPGINSVDIASRGVDDNSLFFEGNTEAVLSVIPAVPKMTYRRGLSLFETSITEAELIDYDFVFLRLPQPIPVKLFQALLQAMPEDHIINEPSGIMRTASKAFLLEVADLCPPVSMIKKQAEVLALARKSPVVLKPLYAYAGQGIVKVTNLYVEDVAGTRMNHPQYFKTWSPPYVAMQFLHRVTEGDKRTLVVNGEIMGSALRMPAEGRWMCNVAQGGTALHAVADQNERHIASHLSSELRKHGIVIFGFDTLVNDEGKRVLSEVNTMSIGGLRQIHDAEGKPIMKKVVHELVRHLDTIWYGKTV